MAMRFTAGFTDRKSLDDWFTRRRFAGILALLIVAAYPGLAGGSTTFVFRDFGIFTYPVAHYIRESFWRGEVPLWNPLNLCGIPFLAQWNTQALYPPALVYVLLPMPWSLNLFLLGHLFLAGLGMYHLASAWTGNRFAASFAGVAFAFGGLMICCLIWVSNLAALAWIPWVLLLAERAWNIGGRALVIASLAGAMQMLTGAPEFILLTWLLLLAMAGGQCLAQRTFNPEVGCAQRIWRFSLVVLFVTGLSAAQLFPFLDLIAHSQRTSGYAGSQWSLPWWGSANFFVPLFRCYPWKTGVFFQEGQQWISSYYAGVGVLALAGLAAWKVPRKRVWLLVAFAIVCTVLAMGDQSPFNAMVRRLVPELGFMRFPVKLIAMAAFALPVLAAFGIASCQSAADESRGSGLAVACVVMGLVILGIAWFAHARPLPYFASGVSIRSAVTRLGIVLLTLGGVAILLKTARPDLGLLLRGGVLALVWLDLTTQSPLIHPQADGELFVPNVMPSELKPHPGESRLMVSPNANYTLSYNMLSDPAADFALRRNALVACCNLLEDAPKLDGFFSLYPREVREVLSPIYMPTNGYPERLADFLGVSRFNTATGNFKWEARTTYLPLITAGQRPIFADRDETLKAMLGPDFDPARVVYLPIRSVTGVQVYTNTQARVRSSRFGAHRVEFEIECASPSLAVIAQTYYHRWHAYIGGNEIPLLRANHGFQAIQAPTGKSNVELVYEDAPFGIGVVLSALTVLGLGAVWVKARRVDIGPSSS